mgnify:FL=1
MKLRYWLKRQGLSQMDFQKVAKEMGYSVSQSAIAKWSCGDRIPRKDEMQMINHITEGQVKANDFYEMS